MNIALFSLTSMPNTSAEVDHEFWFIPLDILAILCMILVIMLASLYLSIIIFDKTCHTISMMLMGNSCFIALLAGCCILGMCLFTLENDLKQVHYQDSLCVFRGYTAYVSCSLFNFSFLLQALYRYMMVVYPSHFFWHSTRFLVSLVAFKWIFCCVFPLLFTLRNEITYNADNQICQVPFELSFAILYIVHCAYLIPVLLMVFLYFKLVRYVRQMNKRVVPVNTLNRAKRQLKLLQHTIVTVLILVILCLPYAFFIFMSFFTPPPKYHLRVSYIFADVSILSVMLALFHFTDPLKASIIKNINRTFTTETEP